jgi:hypothetical protein
VSLHTRLQRRKSNGIYHCRVAVPAKLQHIIGKGEIYTSLKTANPILARERVKAESYRIDQMLAKAIVETWQVHSKTARRDVKGLQEAGLIIAISVGRINRYELL